MHAVASVGGDDNTSSILFCMFCSKPRRITKQSGRKRACECTKKKKKINAKTRTRSETFLPSHVRPITVNSEIVEREQSLSVFAADYSQALAKNIERPSIFHALFNSDISTDLLLRTGIDTLTTAYIAERTSSPTLSYQSQMLYSKLLHLVSHSLKTITGTTDTSPKSLTTLSKHYTFMRNTLLAICFTSILGLFPNSLKSYLPANHFDVHFAGAQRVLEAYGPEFLLKVKNSSSAVDRWITDNLCSVANFLGVANMTPWASINSKEWSIPFAWTDREVMLPHVLQRTRTLFSSSLVGKFDDAERNRSAEQEAWALVHLMDMSRLLESDGIPPTQWTEEIHLSMTEKCDYSIEEHVFLWEGGQHFDTFYHFRSNAYSEVVAGMRMLISYITNLVVRCNRRRLITHSAFEGWDRLRTQKEYATQKCVASAEVICQGVWHWSKQPTLADARFLLIALEMAQIIFEDARSVQKLGWTQACIIATRSRISRLEAAGKRTLCPVDRIAVGLKGGCGWRDYER